jgi:hypothetical protein
MLRTKSGTQKTHTKKSETETTMASVAAPSTLSSQPQQFPFRRQDSINDDRNNDHDDDDCQSCSSQSTLAMANLSAGLQGTRVSVVVD